MATGSVAAVPIPRGFSIHLDLMRFGAAFMVMLFHIRHWELGPPQALVLIPNRGHDFVILFFVLSGYVVAYAADRKRSEGLREFALDRMARVYSVALPVLITCTFLAVAFDGQLDPERNWSNGTDQPWLTLALNLVFMGQSWEMHRMPFTNEPYWSLCYEVMYYAAFAAFIFLRGSARVLMLLVVAALAGPKIALLMPCWLAGVAAYSLRDKWPLKRVSAVLLAFVVPALILLALNRIGFAPSVRAFIRGWFTSSYEALDFSKDFLIDYVAATLAAVHIYAARYLGLRWPERLATVIKAGAAMSFSLYLFHGPLLPITLHAFGSDHDGWACLLVASVGIPLVCFAVSRLTESRRSTVRRWLDRLLPGRRRETALAENRPLTGAANGANYALGAAKPASATALTK